MVKIQLNERGLVPAIAQDANTSEVLMLGYMSPGAMRRTLDGGDVWYYSRSRSDLWHKGETSGNYLHLKSATVDCDGDVVLLQVEPDGPVCHTDNRTCFFTALEQMPEFSRQDSGPGVIEEVFAVVQDRKSEMPDESYTAGLFRAGIERVGQKVVEEAGEVATAGVRGDRDQVVKEVADLIYHALVLLSASGARPGDVWRELRERRK